MRRDYESIVGVLLGAAFRGILSEVLEAESGEQEKLPARLAKKYPDAIDVEYRVIEDET